MSFKATILGCGSSGGVPRIGIGWGSCDAKNPKNRRRRCSLFVERFGAGGNEMRGVTQVLVDTSPDLRDQLLGANITRLDALLYTHEHADHTHGIDDVRPLVQFMRRRLKTFADPVTMALLRSRFSYCFEAPENSEYPPIMDPEELIIGKKVEIHGDGGTIEALPIDLIHGNIKALGFRFGAFAYAPDLNHVPLDSVAAFKNLDILVLDALRDHPHPSHFSVKEALAFVEFVQPKRTILTNLHTDQDYAKLSAKLPEGVEPAYDGMELEWDA
jgi:phosphoribosyl 1,2-cyclic phosphate phosphodiesterase